jgi:hypothetical protein
MAEKRKRARQERLPETSNEIKELEEIGYEYAALRDERQALLRREIDLKKKVKDAMKKHHLKAYKYEDIEILMIPGEENVKVKVAKERKHEQEALAAAEEAEAELNAAETE